MGFLNTRSTVWLPALLAVFVCAQAFCDTEAVDKTASPEKASAEAQQPKTQPPKPKPIDPPSAESIDKGIRRGVDFLLQRQVRNGAWGSARNTKGLNIFAPAPGSHHAFRAAVTSLCLSALIESGDSRQEVTKAVDLAEKWLLSHLKAVRRADGETLYNNWAHAYAIQALVDLYHYRKADGPNKGDKSLLKDIKQLIEHQIDMLGRYECIDGGWAYYDLNAHTQRTSASSMGFVSATVLVALKEARQIGIEVPQRLIDRAMASIVRQRKSDFSYCYGEYLKYTPMRGINRPGASTGRSQACNLAMYIWGDKKTTLDTMRVWLDRLYARNMWLEIGRKRPIPHESWMQIAGYFYYYGHFYAACCIEQLPVEDRPYFQGHLAHILLPLQEKDGSWWDYPFYDYHQQYGTALTVMALIRCRAAEVPSKNAQ